VLTPHDEALANWRAERVPPPEVATWAILALASTLVLLGVVALFAFGSHEPPRDLKMPTDAVREVSGVVLADGTVVLYSTTGEHCTLDPREWHNVRPGQQWVCLWQKKGR